MNEKITNWAGNLTFGAARIERPRDVAQLQDIVRKAGKLRALGCGHSFNTIADTDGVLVSLAHLPRMVEIDREKSQVRIDGGATYADFVQQTDNAGFALANVASLPHITVAGAVSTATHGSGDKNRNLAAAVAGIKLVTGNGDIVSYTRGDADFAGAVVGVGALGTISELTLDLVPRFDVRQTLYTDLSVTALLRDFDGVMGSAYSVSLFTRWQGEGVDQVWVKALADAGEPPEVFSGAPRAQTALHPVPGMSGADCTPQMGVSGPWHERLFHFPVGHKASAGAELQSEFFVARKDAVAAIEALRAVQERFAPALFVGEIRSIAGDELWMSAVYQQDSIGFHFTWRPEWDATLAANRVVEAALAPFSPRPHWAKLFTPSDYDLAALYPKLGAFRALADRLDPAGKMRNDWAESVIFA